MNKLHSGNNWFTIKSYTSLPKDLEEKVSALKRACFNWQEKMTEKAKQEHYDRFCSKRDRIKYILAFESNFLIGMAIALNRKINFQNKTIYLGGIGSVCVHPHKRRKGVATALLKETVTELKNSGCDIAYLCTNVKDKGKIKLYNHFGFVPLGRSHTYLGQSGRKFEDNDAMIAPINTTSIFQEVLKDKEPFSIGVGNW